METFQDVGWSQFSSVTSDAFGSGVVINTNNNSVIYFAPSAAPFVGMYHPDSDTFSRINIDAVKYYLENGQAEPLGSEGVSGYDTIGTEKYSAAVFAPSNGNIYFIPYNNVQVGVLNTQTNVFSVILQTFNQDGRKYSGGVLSKDGTKVYMIPYNEARIGVVDVNTHTITTISILTTVNKKYVGGVLAGNGKVYLVPGNRLQHIGVLDPTAGDTFSQIDISSFLIPAHFARYTFNNAVEGENGMIYFIPWDGTTIGILDTTTHVFSALMDISTSFPEGQIPSRLYNQGIVSGGNKIYLVPGMSDNMGLLTLSSSGNTFEQLGAWVPSIRQWEKYNGGVLLNGKIYMVPRTRAAIDVVDLNIQGCTACAVGTYSAEHGASACSTCPTYSSSPLNTLTLDRCVCDVGYNGGDSGTCTACVPGEPGCVIQNELNNDNPNLIPSTLYGCNAGYYFMAASCVACPAGTYNPKQTRGGIESCTLCRQGKFSPHEGVALANSCQSCESGKFHRFRGMIDDSKCKTCSCM
jgi:hypothetical protein